MSQKTPTIAIRLLGFSAKEEETFFTVLAVARERDGAARGGHGGQRAAALGVAVQLGDDNTANVHFLLESSSLVGHNMYSLLR